jgi:hypothetical protein
MDRRRRHHVNGEVKAVGSVPPKNKLKEWLLAAAKSSA